MRSSLIPLTKILFIEGAIDFGGSVKSLLMLLKHLDKSKYLPIVVCLYDVPYLNKLKDTGVEVRVLKGAGTLLFTRLSHILQLMRLIKKLDISLLHLNNGIYYPAVIAACLCRVPCVSHFRSLPYNIFTEKPTIPFLTLLFGKFSSHNIAISEAVKNRYVELGFKKEKISVIPDGIEIDAIRKNASIPRPAMYKTNGAFIIGSVCRLSEEKGLNYLIDAIPIILKEIKNIKCVLVGDGPLMKQLKTQVNNLGLSETVIFAGHQDNPYPILSEFDIFVLPSLREGLPISIMEAMALGMPVVASKVGGVSELVSNMINGILVSSGDIEQIANSVISLYKDSNLRRQLAHSAYIKAKESFAFQKTIQHVELKYAELIKGNG
mgnify:CR=1 FL=1